MNAAEKLLIKIPALQRETTDFFRELARDERMVGLFVTDPMGVLRERLSFVTPTTVQADADASSNRLLFSILSNKDFLTWIRDYQDNLTKQLDWALSAPTGQPIPNVIDRTKIMQDLADAMLKMGDREILMSVLRAPVTTELGRRQRG